MNENINEEWKPVKKYEGLYEVSNLGRIKSLNYRRTKKEKILKYYNNNKGYQIVRLYKDSKAKTYRVHRLVAQAFLEDYSDDLQVDHINTIKNDNKLSNLRMATAKENSNNELTLKHCRETHKGKNNPMYGKHHSENVKKKISEAHKGKILSEEHKKKIGEAQKKAVYCVELDKIFNSAKECANKLGIYSTGITAVCRGKRKTCGGYHFMYIDKMYEAREEI